MISRKYQADYRMEKVTDKKGRVVKRPVYIGPYFKSQQNELTVSHSRWICMITCILLWVMYCTAFVQDGYVPRQLYVIILFLITVFPLIYLTWSTITLVISRVPFDHETSDDLQKKFAPASKVLLILSGLATAAVAVALILGRDRLTGGDAVFFVCNAFSCVLAALLYTRRQSFQTVELERNGEELEKLLAERENRAAGKGIR